MFLILMIHKNFNSIQTYHRVWLKNRKSLMIGMLATIAYLVNLSTKSMKKLEDEFTSFQKWRQFT